MVFRLGIFGVLVALLIGVLIFAFSIMNQSKHQVAAAPPPAPPPMAHILVAAHQLQGGALLQPGDIGSSAVPPATIPPGSIPDTTDDRAALVGAMVRFAIAPGAPLLNSAVIHPGDHGFLAAVLSPGMRAVTIAVDAVTGANGLIWPGDNVDVLLTQNIPGAPEDKSIAAEVVLSDVRVIATGSELIKDASNGPNGGPPAQTVTLEVTPEEAARCLVATNLGKLSLIVHSAQVQLGAAASQPPPAQPPVWSGEVSPALANAHPDEPQVSTVHVFQGTPDGQDYNF
jgi:pilus assembly protein CpaB